MLEKTLNRIMHGPNTLEGKIIAVFMAVVLSLMTWNAATITYAFADDKSDGAAQVSSQPEKKTETTEEKPESQTSQQSKESASKTESKSDEQVEKSSEAKSKESESKSSNATSESGSTEEQPKKTSESDAKASDNAATNDGAEGDAAKGKDSQSGTEASAGKESDSKSAEPEADKATAGNEVVGTTETESNEAGSSAEVADEAQLAPKLMAASDSTFDTETADEKKKTYKITWTNADGKVLAVDEVEAGKMPTYNGDTPTLKETEDYTYTFAGWSPKVAVATNDRNYRAVYDSHLKDSAPDESLGTNVRVTITNILNNLNSVNGQAMPASKSLIMNAGNTKQASGLFSHVGGKNRTSSSYGVNYKFLNVFTLGSDKPVVWNSANEGITITKIHNGGDGKVTVYLSDGTSVVKDSNTLNVSPVYMATPGWFLNYNYIDNISTGSGSWSNMDAVSSYTHTFKDPDKQPHYEFVNWEQEDTGDTYREGDSYTYPSDTPKKGQEQRVINTYAVWQPSVSLDYFNWNGSFLKQVEKFSDITTDTSATDIEGAKFLGWYKGTGEDAEEAEETYKAPETTKTIVERTIYEVYAHYATAYKIEHNLQSLLDESKYDLGDEATVEDVLMGKEVSADKNNYEGFTFNESVDGTCVKAVVDNVNLVLKLYYDRNKHDVTYSYEGFVPSDAPAAPASTTYRYGETVNVASAPSATGYVFGGWSRQGSFQMPDADVAITGSWTPAPDTAYTVKHWLQNVSGNGYGQDQSVAADEVKTGTTGERTAAAARSLTGFTAQAFSQAEIAADGSTVINIYYDRNVYTVTYAYAGTAPAGASALPAQASYRYGADVSVADAATAAGYTFSGWDRQGTFTMPAENVTITGGFTQIPANDDTDEDEGTTPPAPTPTNPDAADDAADPAGPAAPAAPAPAAPVVPAIAAVPAAANAGIFGAARGAIADNPGTAIPDDANPLAETIEDDGNPLANLGAWSLFDLLCTILTALLAIVMLVRGIGRKRHGDDEDDAEAEGASVRTMSAEAGEEEEDPESTVYKRRRALRVASIVPAIGAIVLFILTQDLTQPMVWFDMWSLVFAIIAIVNIVLLIASRRRKADDDSQDDEQQPAGYAPSAA